MAWTRVFLDLAPLAQALFPFSGGRRPVIKGTSITNKKNVFISNTNFNRRPAYRGSYGSLRGRYIGAGGYYGRGYYGGGYYGGGYYGGVGVGLGLGASLGVNTEINTAINTNIDASSTYGGSDYGSTDYGGSDFGGSDYGGGSDFGGSDYGGGGGGDY